MVPMTNGQTRDENRLEEFLTSAEVAQPLKPVKRLPEPDHMTVVQVAARLGKSRSWLERRLGDDARSETPRFQFHSYIGRTRIWDENAYQALRNAIVSVDSKSNCAVKPSISSGLSGWESAHNACEKLQASIDQRLGRGKWRRRSSGPLS